MDEVPVKLATQEKLDDFSWFQRGTVREHMQFASRTFCQRTPEGSRQTVELEEIPYNCHVYHRYGGLVCTALTDATYDTRVIFTYMGKILRDFNLEHPEWNSINQDTNLHVEGFAQSFIAYQNENCDQIKQIEKNLDDTKDIMHKNIDQVLERGENLDSLLKKSEDVSAMSYQFQKKARNMNSCCPT